MPSLRSPAACSCSPPPWPASAPPFPSARLPLAGRASDVRRDPVVGQRPHVGPRRTRCRPTASCPRPWGPVWRLSTTTTTAGWTCCMVNSGPADFYTPKAPLKHALYKNNRDGTFTDVTEKAGIVGQTVRDGLRRRRLRQRRLPGHLHHRLRPPDALPEQRQRHLHRHHREGRAGARRRTGRPAPSGSTTTTTAGSTCSCAASSSSR